ncbi:MAG: [Fe-S]-binding protein, partial [Planctomycetes bacterium]|nr:[Fe-S]-binding protein [Planctomycetota bacterium]
MLFPDHVDYRIGGEELDLPRMFRARQLFQRQRLDDIEGAVGRELATLRLPDLTGKRVALTAGSRGVANQ